MHTGIISRRGQNWNTCLTPHGAAMAMWMSYTAKFKLKVSDLNMVFTKCDIQLISLSLVGN